jgi:hypothetical protein
MEGLSGRAKRAARSRSGSAAANRFWLASFSRFPKWNASKLAMHDLPRSLFFLVTARRVWLDQEAKSNNPNSHVVCRNKHTPVSKFDKRRTLPGDAATASSALYPQTYGLRATLNVVLQTRLLQRLVSPPCVCDTAPPYFFPCPSNVYVGLLWSSLHPTHSFDRGNNLHLKAEQLFASSNVGLSEEIRLRSTLLARKVNDRHVTRDLH